MPVDLGTARIPETHEPGELVEGFSGGVVDGLAEHLVVAPAPHMDDLAVSA